MSGEDAVRVVEMTERALNEHDFARYQDLHASDCRYVGPGHAEPVIGGAALTDDLRNWAAAFPDLRVERDLLVANGDWVCATAVIRGTHLGPLTTDDGTVLPPTNRPISLRNCILLKVEDGRITEHREYYDQLEFGSQLGL